MRKTSLLPLLWLMLLWVVPAALAQQACAAMTDCTVGVGVSDAALLDVITGRVGPEGKLPFELPSSMEAVAAQRPDVPHDSRSPLYKFGYGLRY